MSRTQLRRTGYPVQRLLRMRRHCSEFTRLTTRLGIVTIVPRGAHPVWDRRAESYSSPWDDVGRHFDLTTKGDSSLISYEVEFTRLWFANLFISISYAVSYVIYSPGWRWKWSRGCCGPPCPSRRTASTDVPESLPWSGDHWGGGTGTCGSGLCILKIQKIKYS